MMYGIPCLQIIINADSNVSSIIILAIPFPVVVVLIKNMPVFNYLIYLTIVS